MARGIVVRGRLRGRQIDLDAPIDQRDGEVEVVVRAVEAPGAAPAQDVFAFLRSLPPVTRTAEDIHRQIAEERDSWGDR